MINVSNEYKSIVANKDKPPEFLTDAVITLTNGTVLNVTDANIVIGGLKIDDAVSDDNSFQIGSAIINKCTLQLNNIEGKFNRYDFSGAKIEPYAGLKLSGGEERFKKGEFYVSESPVMNSVVTLTALDNMSVFDADYSISTLTYPATLFAILSDICSRHNIVLATSKFDNWDHVVNRRPVDDALTDREMVSYVAQIAGCFARFNVNGALELKWYTTDVFEQSDNLDGGEFDGSTPYSTGDSTDGGDFTFSETAHYDGGTFQQMKRYHHIYALSQSSISTDDIIITGIQVKAHGDKEDYGETFLYGSEGYVIAIEDNPLIQENTSQKIATSIGRKIVGIKFRVASVNALADPSREAGDVAYLSDTKGDSYQILLAGITWQVDKNDIIRCSAQTPSYNNSKRYSAATKTYIDSRKYVEQQLSSYDLAVQQLTNLMAYSFGVYKTKEKQSDGSIIYYMHNKPTLAESQTIWKMTADAFAVSTDGGQTWNAGFDSSGNAILNVLSAIGVNADWIKVLTYFTVGDKFSVDSTGHLKAVDADLTGKITAESGTIAGMDITSTSLERTYQVDTGNGTQNYTTKLGFSGNFFSISTENQDNTLNGGMNVSINDDGTPEMNIYVRDVNGLRDDQIFLNGQPILNKVNDTYDQLWKLIDFCIQKFGYNPES